MRGFRSRDPTHVWVLALSYYRYSDVKEEMAKATP